MFVIPIINPDINHVNVVSQTTTPTWRKLDSGWCKLNVDGSAKNGRIAAEGVVRSEDGRWGMGFTKFLEGGTTVLVETWALSFGLVIENSLKITKLAIETDSQLVYNLLMKEKNDLHPLAMLISNCRLLLCSLTQYSLRKIPRSCNRYADIMASFARISRGPQRSFSKPLPFVFSAYLQEL